jgi:daunorubicin resistance ABC transporter ATP-binding subunit
MDPRPSPAPAVRVEGVVKRFGATVALAGVELEIPAGTVFGLLGPNGAGKTTLVRILATLLAPDAGRVEILGHDVVREPGAVRELLGLTGQFAAVDELLTGRENLEMFGRLFRLSRDEARRRAGEVLDRFDLAGAADRPARTYSGGMRRRLDLASSLLSRPRMLFLDEPTTGLDPRSRLEMWSIVGELVADGTTILLTTQYLEEADRLADRITVLDLGRVIAVGTADDLKRQVGGQVVELRPAEAADLDKAGALLGELAGNPASIDRDAGRASVGVDDPALLAESVRRFDDAGVALDELALRRPSLDEVFLQLTGHRAADSEQQAKPAPKGRRGRRRKDA